MSRDPRSALGNLKLSQTEPPRLSRSLLSPLQARSPQRQRPELCLQCRDLALPLAVTLENGASRICASLENRRQIPAQQERCVTTGRAGARRPRTGHAQVCVDGERKASGSIKGLCFRTCEITHADGGARPRRPC